MCYCFHHISWLKSKDNPSFPELSPYADGKLSIGSIHIYLKFSLKDQKSRFPLFLLSYPKDKNLISSCFLLMKS